MVRQLCYSYNTSLRVPTGILLLKMAKTVNHTPHQYCHTLTSAQEVSQPLIKIKVFRNKKPWLDKDLLRIREADTIVYSLARAK